MQSVEEYRLSYRSFNRPTDFEDYDDQEFDNRTRTVNVNFESGYLPDVLAQVQEFLQSAGFGYIENLVALTYNSMTGEVMEHAASDA